VNVKAGDTVIIQGNLIFSFMGLSKVQGEVIQVRQDGVSFRCRETKAIETADFKDGNWSVKPAAKKAA